MPRVLLRILFGIWSLSLVACDQTVSQTWVGSSNSSNSTNSGASPPTLQALSISTLPNTGTLFTWTPPNGIAYQNITLNLGTAPQAAQFCAGSQALGVTGTAACADSSSAVSISNPNTLLLSNALRDINTSPLTQMQEITQYGGISLPSNYRDVPDSTKDFDTFSLVRPSQDCGTPTSMSSSGLNSALLSNRITHCQQINTTSATWNGSTQGVTGQSLWKLVVRKGVNTEVWQDQRTGLLWSSRATNGSYWCAAAGNSQTDGICNTNTRSFCAEVLSPVAAGDGTAGAWSTVYSNQKGGLGALSSPGVRWRLPTQADYQMADVDGIRYVLPDIVGGYEWTATTQRSDRTRAWVFLPGTVSPIITDMDGPLAVVFATYPKENVTLFSVRCVGR